MSLLEGFCLMSILPASCGFVSYRRASIFPMHEMQALDVFDPGRVDGRCLCKPEQEVGN